MRIVKKIAKVFLYTLLVLLLLGGIGFGYLLHVSKLENPPIKDISPATWPREQHAAEFFTIHNNWFRKSESGLYEMYVEGAAFERGAVNGKLSAELVQRQEDYFNNQIEKMIPSRTYLHFLKYVIGWFNRNLDKNVATEFKEEIYGVSQSASDKYDYIGSNYQRILNYHAAHDIGHALQNMALVGCTSFGTWNSASEGGNLIIGRNFDFYVGDDFAKNKIVLFQNPSRGYKFMSITWGGFIGVVSGMNEKGLTVTINAAKSGIPSGSATPVSLVAREILQYAENIDQAITIARNHTMFVSESFLVGSAQDKKAVIIEKTPDTLDVYDPGGDSILCANHFQSPSLAGSALNREQLQGSASPYRYQRLQQLMQAAGKNTVEKTAAILRDRRGLDNADIGDGNEKAMNQLIAHHAVIFEPEKRLVWVSTGPWQLGAFRAYNLNQIFAMNGLKTNVEVSDSLLTIPADSFLLTSEYAAFEQFRQYKKQMLAGETINPDSLIASNPSFYYAYVLAGDYCYKRENWYQAKHYYQQALTHEIATLAEKQYIQQQVSEIDKNHLPGR